MEQHVRTTGDPAREGGDPVAVRWEPSDDDPVALEEANEIADRADPEAPLLAQGVGRALGVWSEMLLRDVLDWQGHVSSELFDDLREQLDLGPGLRSLALARRSKAPEVRFALRDVEHRPPADKEVDRQTDCDGRSTGRTASSSGPKATLTARRWPAA